MIQKPKAGELTSFKLVGMCGKAGSGKDTVADYLCHSHPALWFMRVSLAAKVKEVARLVFDISNHHFNNRRLKEKPLPEVSNYSPRHLAQLVGTECFRAVFGEWVWVDVLHRQLSASGFVGEVVLVTDVRYTNEMQWVLEQGGILVYLEREQEQVISGVVRHSSEQIATIEECQQLVQLYGGSLVVIQNNGSIKELHDAIQKQLVPLLLTAT